MQTKTNTIAWSLSLMPKMSDETLEANLEKLVNAQGYELCSCEVNRSNKHAPSMTYSTKNVGEENPSKTFTLVLTGPSANIGLVVNKDGIPHIMLRRQQKSSTTELWCVPGGHGELTDAGNISETAFREFSEEAGGIAIPSGTKVWIDDTAVISVANNVSTTDTTVLMFIPDEKSESVIQQIDESKWILMPVEQAASEVEHGPSNRAARNAYIFSLGGNLKGKTFIR